MMDRADTDQNGFSMLEIVIALVVLSVISASGVVVYNKSISERTKRVATENTAQAVYNIAYSYLKDGSSKTSPEDAAQQYNDGQLKTDIDTPLTAAHSNLYESKNTLDTVNSSSNNLFAHKSFNTANISSKISFIGAELPDPDKSADNTESPDDPKISVQVEVLSEERIRVIAEYSNTDIVAVRETPIHETDNESDDDTPSEDTKNDEHENIEHPGTNDDEEQKPEENEQTQEPVTEQPKIEEPEFEQSPPVQENTPTVPSKTLADTLSNDTTSRLTYRCDSDKTGYIGVLNISQGTEVFWKVKDTANKTAVFIPYGEKDNNFSINNEVSDQVRISNHSSALTLKAGITYEIIVVGEFQVLSSPLNSSTGDNLSDCLINGGNFGNSSGLEYITYLSADNLTAMPSSIPTTVKSLQGAFIDAKRFNDRNIVSWNTNNIINMSYLFKNATSFNQPIGSWSTGNVKDMTGMFENAKTFNQEVRKWDVKDVLTMKAMFKNATNFNQGFSSWNTKSLTDTSSMFEGATSFNQKMSGFHTHNVVDMSRMFKNATSFNGMVNSWQTSNVKDMTEMFYNAKSFNQKFNGWKVSNVSQYSNFGTGSGLKSNSYPKFR